jgi:hypothetical protein
MTEPLSNTPATSPYGPDNVAGRVGDAPVTPAPHPAWVDRGRRILTVAIWITAGLSVALTVVLIILGVTNPGADDLVVGEFADTLVWGSIFAAPISFTIAINLLIWRGLLRGLSGRTRGQAVALVIVIALSLAVASVLLVTALLFLGFLVGAFAGASSGFGA